MAVRKEKSGGRELDRTLAQLRKLLMSRQRKLKPDMHTLAQLRSLAEIQSTWEETAAVMQISKNHLHTFFQACPLAKQIFDEGKEAGKMSLRRKLWSHADKNFACAIFLAKNHLGMRDNFDVDTTVSHNVSVELMQILKGVDGQQRSLPDWRAAELNGHAKNGANGSVIEHVPAPLDATEVEGAGDPPIPDDHPMKRFN